MWSDTSYLGTVAGPRPAGAKISTSRSPVYLGWEFWVRILYRVVGLAVGTQ